MKYGLFGKFTAREGKRDQLTEILLKAAELLKSNPDCINYIVNISERPQEIWVWELWTDKQAHDKSLEPEEIRALIQKAMPLIESMSDSISLNSLGGKGFN